MKRQQILTVLTLSSLLATGCVSTSTHQKTVDEAAILASNLTELNTDYQKLENKEATCVKDLDSSQRLHTETQKQLEGKQLSLERAQADIVRIEKVLADRNQEAGKVMTQIRQENDLLMRERDLLAHEKEYKEKELRAAQVTYSELIDQMKAEISRGEVTISELKGKLTVNLVEKILFDSGSAEIKSGGKEVLSKVGTILNDVADKEIRVEGYSDNLPISPRLQSIYPSNWELSSARAISVVQFLRNSLNIPGERLSASGFAEFRPIADNNTPEGRAQNRRIQIILVPLDAEVVK